MPRGGSTIASRWCSPRWPARAPCTCLPARRAFRRSAPGWATPTATVTRPTKTSGSPITSRGSSTSPWCSISSPADDSMPEASQTSLLPDSTAAPVRERLYVGTCSWAEKSFIKSDFYPRAIRRAEDRLRYYTTQFPTVEVDASYFALLPPAYSQKWAEATPPGFIMHAKAFGLFTGHGAQVQRLPPGFAALLPERLREAAEVRLGDVPEEFLNACWDHFRAFLDPLARVMPALEAVTADWAVIRFPAATGPGGARGRQHRGAV